MFTPSKLLLVLSCIASCKDFFFSRFKNFASFWLIHLYHLSFLLIIKAYDKLSLIATHLAVWIAISSRYCKVFSEGGLRPGPAKKRHEKIYGW